MALVAGGGSGPNRTNNLAQHNDRPMVSQRQTGRMQSSPSPAQPTDHARNTLAQTARTGKAVDAGTALRFMDQNNNGNKVATNQQVSQFNLKPSLYGGTSIIANTAPVQRNINDISEKDGERTVTQRTERVSTWHDGNTTRTQTTKTETKSSVDELTYKLSQSDHTTYKIFDEKGQVINAENHQPKQETESKSEANLKATIAKDSASLTMSGSYQSGDYSVSGSKSTVLDENGLTQKAEASAGTDTTRVKGGGGFTIDEDSLTLSGQVGADIGPVGVGHKVAKELSADGTTTDTSATSGNIQTPTDKAVSGSYKIEYKQTNSEKLTENPDGSTTYKVTGETKISQAIGVDVKKVEIDIGWSEGVRSIQTITVPKGVDVKSIDLAKPEDWPVGTRVMTKSEDFDGSTLGLAYAGFGVDGTGETREGTAIVMEKQTGEDIAVATGPTSGFTNSGKLKFDIGAGFSAELGVQNKVDFTFYKTFNLNLSASGGAETFANIMAGQKAPEQNVDGVSNLMDTTTGDWSYTGSAKINTFFGAWGPENKESSSTIWKTYPDGHEEYSRSYDANGDGTVMLMTTKSSLDGEQWSDSVYTLTVDVTEKDKGSVYYDHFGLNVGDKVEITLTADEIQELRHTNSSFVVAGEAGDAEIVSRMNNSFVDSIARKGGAYDIMHELCVRKSVSEAEGQLSAKIDYEDPLPGDMKIIQNMP